GRGRGPDEPRGLGQDRRHEIGTWDQGLGRRIRCILPLPRWRRGNRQSGRNRHHSAGRLCSRPGNHWRCQQARPGDGHNRHPALPALSGSMVREMATGAVFMTAFGLVWLLWGIWLLKLPPRLSLTLYIAAVVIATSLLSLEIPRLFEPSTAAAQIHWHHL